MMFFNYSLIIDAPNKKSIQKTDYITSDWYIRDIEAKITYPAFYVSFLRQFQ